MERKMVTPVGLEPTPTNLRPVFETGVSDQLHHGAIVFPVGLEPTWN